MPPIIAFLLMIYPGMLVMALISLTWKLRHLNEERSKRYRWKFVTPESSKEKDHVER
jgi:hypothetical protein